MRFLDAGRSILRFYASAADRTLFPENRVVSFADKGEIDIAESEMTLQSKYRRQRIHRP